MPVRLLAVLLLIVGSAFPQPRQSPPQEIPPSQAQTGPQASDAQTKIRVNSDLVILPVTVKDRFGDLVPDLLENDFRIFDDNVEQSVDVFTAEAFPLSLVVLIDDDLKSNHAAQMTPSLRAILAGISASDEALICRFDLFFHPGEAFTSDIDKLWTALKEAQEHTAPSTAGPVPFVASPSDHPVGVGEPHQAAQTRAGARPTKALDDAIHSAAELLHDRGLARRKIVLVISDGINGPQFNQHTYEDSLAALLHDNISVYSLAVGNSLSKHKYARLLNYANDTGGDIYYAATRNAMESLYSQITEEARHEYTLAYVPRGIKRNSPYHKVEVRVAREAVTIKTRQGYYTSPPVDPGADKSDQSSPLHFD